MKIVLSALLLTGLALQAAPVRSGKAESELVSDVRSVRPGHNLTVALRLKANPRWHTYWINPGESGLPTRIKWTLPEGFSAGRLQFPVPHRFEGGGAIGFGYEGEVFLFTTIAVPEKLADRSITLGASVSWLACDPTQCLPGRATLSLKLPVANEEPKPSTWSAKLVKAQKKLPIELVDANANLTNKKDHWLVTLKLPKKWQGFPSSPQFFPENNSYCDLKKPVQFTDIAGGIEIKVPMPKEEATEGRFAFVLDGLAQPLRFSMAVRH